MATAQEDGDDFAGVMHEPNYLLDDDPNQSMTADEDETENPEQIRDQDRFLPIANVAKIMKDRIPSNGKIAKDAKECVQECVSEFVSFVTSEAADRCHQEKRKTINGEDLLFAMSTLGFDSYVEPLKMFLSKYRDSLKSEKTGVVVVPEISESMATIQGEHANASNFVRAPQTVSIIHDTREATHVTHQLAAPQQHHLQAQNIYTAAYQQQGDMQQQIHYQT